MAYSPHNRNTIDMVLSINGIPLIAIELKNQLKGQSIEHAKNNLCLTEIPKETVFSLIIVF